MNANEGEIEPVVYTIRPNRTSIWLPETLAQSLGLRRGAILTEAQFSDPRTQDLIFRRAAKEPKAKSKTQLHDD